MENRKNYKIVKYEVNDTSIDIRFDIENKTIWLTQNEICYILNKDRTTISRHISTITNNASVVASEVQTVAYDALVQIEGNKEVKRNVKLYNLDIIEEISKRSRSKSGSDFIKWANDLISNGIDNQVFELSPYKANNYEIVTFENDEVVLDIRVSPTEDTVWLTQNEIAILFNVTKQNVSFHIQKILDEKELDKNQVVKFYLTTATDGKVYNVTYYNLDMVLSIGYRVNSKRGIEFRRWTNKILKQYLIKGYALNNHRLNNRLESYDYLIKDLNETKTMLIKLANNDESKSKTIESIIDRLEKLEDRENIFVGQILYENDFFEGYSFTKKKLSSAKSSIILIDDYVDISVLDMFNGIDKNIDILIYTLPSAKLSKQDISHFESTYKSKVIKTNKAHYRLLIIDDDIYVYTYSIKDLGKKRSAIIKIDFIDKNSLICNL